MEKNIFCVVLTPHKIHLPSTMKNLIRCETLKYVGMTSSDDLLPFGTLLSRAKQVKQAAVKHRGKLVIETQGLLESSRLQVVSATR